MLGLSVGGGTATDVQRVRCAHLAEMGTIRFALLKTQRVTPSLPSLEMVSLSNARAVLCEQ